ncbi:RluA family pseudouridine synthase [Plastoroseomonas hellenica]|uniref:RluA family pseudouridine synthase n=1 Tax=Plastoroseomonas hellenica TaxID=2687306 RepID=UPI001BA73D44|nr:RluA family pseudouridine synthase [Plastoroseomonas hellenica]MBR0645285.1 RluA family pseudouridine synthase [Plastoroseomonas hellenica]
MTITTRQVDPGDADARLDRWFRRHYPQLSQGALQKMLRTGQIRVDGKRAEANSRLAAGQEIRIPPLPDAPPPAMRGERFVSEHDAKDLVQSVIYRDDSVIAINKPYGLPVQGGPGIKRHLDGMLDALRFGSEHRPHLVHRLDRDTTGVLLLARNPRAAAKLASAFRSRDAEKTYWAITVGRPDILEGRIDLPLDKIGGPRGERVMPVEDGQGVHAVTYYRVMDMAQKRAAWLEMQPHTGRTHQLRVHAASALGCPILGDGKYGQASAHIEGLSGQLHLHARAITLPHPDGGTISVAASLPPHMKASFEFLGFDRPRTPKPKRSA